MIIKNAYKIFKNNDYILGSTQGLSFNVNRVNFPQVTNSNRDGYIYLDFYDSTLVTVDFGDGNKVSYQTKKVGTIWRYSIRYPDATGYNSYDNPYHTYTDGVTNHTVTFFYNTATLYSIIMQDMQLPVQDFAFGFARHTSLKSFICNNMYTGAIGTAGTFLNIDFKNIERCPLTVLKYSYCFNAASPYHGSIPELLLQRPLTVLSFGDDAFDNSSFATNNMDKIIDCKDTLTSLAMQFHIKDDNFGGGPLPANFSQLTHLASISIIQSSYTKIPDLLNTLPQLKSISLDQGSGVKGWGILPALVNLAGLTLSTTKMDVTVPAWLETSSLIKSLDMARAFRTDRPAGDIDLFISNLYAMVVRVANMNGTVSSKWRGVDFELQQGSSTLETQSPAGTYQQPAGYVQGSNNGTPKSSRERLWVLTKQYGWKCTYKP